MKEKKTYRFQVDGIDCAACAKELEGEIGNLDGVSACTLDYGIHSKLAYDYEGEDAAGTEAAMRKIIEDDQKNPVITAVNAKKKHVEFNVDGIDCAACAKELEEEIGQLDGVENCSLEFGIHSHLSYDTDEEKEDENEAAMRKLIEDDQKNPVITRVGGGHLKTYEYRIHNIDCAPCAIKLADKTREIEGVHEASADFMNETLSFTCEPKRRQGIEKQMIDMIASEEPEVVVSEIREDTKKDADEEEEGSAKVMLARLIIGAVLFVVSLLLNGIPQIVTALVSYVILGYDVLLKAVRNIGHGQLFDEHFLMAVATIAAIYLKDWKEAAGVMLFYQIGEFFQDMAVARSRRSIGDLMDIRPTFAMVERDGEYVEVDPDEVAVNEIIRVKPGERVPLDGIVVKGASSLDTASLTGESKPRDVDVNDEVISGSVNETGVLEIRVTKEYGESTVARILDLVENNDSSKATQEKFITKFSRVYTPIVVFSAIAVAIIVALLYHDINEGIYRACTFLVISCPCALVISIPLSFFAGIGGLSSRGVLVKGANVIETLARVEQVVMDKTGTLTSGKFAVEGVRDANEKKIDVLRDAAYAEHFSNHPIAQGIRDSYNGTISDEEISDVQEIAGRGLAVTVKGHRILAGNYKLMQDNHIPCEEQNVTGTQVYVAKDGVYEGCLILRDQLKEDAVEAVQELKNDGRRTVIVSGDSQAVTDEVARRLGIDEAIGGCLPEDKVNAVKNFKKNGLTAFVGDGVNDAPVINLADAGFAMGALGSDAAIEAADVVLMDDKPSKISLSITSAKRILRIANENIYGAIIIKVLTLILGAFGIANMWMAIFADTGVAMLCVLNSMRLLHIARVPKVKLQTKNA
jgi:Cd2+/Zn2+-exporting ATPase